MARNIKISDLAKELDKAIAGIIKARDFIEVPTLKEIEGSMKQRIHNNGTDSKGMVIGINSPRKGKYSPGYEKRKAEITGEDNLYPINLQLHGDLIKGYTTGRSGDANVLQFQDDLSRKKAGRHEEYYEAEIMRPSESELEDAKEVMRSQAKDVLKDIFN